MRVDFWRDVVDGGFDRPDGSLNELTAELTEMLGSPDPHIRDELAYRVLTAWLAAGRYDDRLDGLGDGMCLGLSVGLGECGTDSVFRRSFSAVVLAEVLARAARKDLVEPDALTTWGDRLCAWWVREQDGRGFVPGKGWAHAIAHGADALGRLAEAPDLGALELVVVLDVVADRLCAPTSHPWLAGEPDRIALAVLAVLSRERVGLDLLQTWLARLRDAALAEPDPAVDPYAVRGPIEAFLRALWLQLTLGPNRPEVRPDLVLELGGVLRATNRETLAG